MFSPTQPFCLSPGPCVEDVLVICQQPPPEFGLAETVDAPRQKHSIVRILDRHLASMPFHLQ